MPAAEGKPAPEAPSEPLRAAETAEGGAVWAGRKEPTPKHEGWYLDGLTEDEYRQRSKGDKDE